MPYNMLLQTHTRRERTHESSDVAEEDKEQPSRRAKALDSLQKPAIDAIQFVYDFPQALMTVVQKSNDLRERCT